MFDNVPPNLPVEPTSSSGPSPASSAPMTPPASPRPAAAPLAPMAKSGKKEPEDIFSGLDQGAPPEGMAPMPELEDHPPRGGGLKIILIAVGGLALLGIIGFTVWMFFIRTPEAPPAPAPVLPGPGNEVVEQPPVIEPQQPVTQPPAGVNIPAPTPITQPPPVPPSEPEPAPPSGPPVEGADLDADKLTDSEEAFYGTDGGNRDTDGDGFGDGDEVQNLFSPVAKSRLLLAEGFMTPETWNGWGYYYPRPWSSIPETVNRQSITTGSAARFQLELRERLAGESLVMIVNEYRPGAQTKSFTTKGGFSAVQTADGTLTAVASGDVVLIITYDLNGERVYDYRTSYAMFLNTLTYASP